MSDDDATIPLAAARAAHLLELEESGRLTDGISKQGALVLARGIRAFTEFLQKDSAAVATLSRRNEELEAERTKWLLEARQARSEQLPPHWYWGEEGVVARCAAGRQMCRCTERGPQELGMVPHDVSTAVVARWHRLNPES